jgi:hypothetical protein
LTSTQALRTKYIKALTNDQKRLTAELKTVTAQLAVLSGKPVATLAYADGASHKVKAKRHLSAAGRLAISRAAKKRWREQKAKAK